MKAVYFEKFGSSEVLKFGELPKPTPKENEVLIKVAYTSVNPVDWKIREGHLQEMLPHKFPIIPGWDVSGTIVELGAQATRFGENDRVYAYTRLPAVHQGTYAEYICLPQDYLARIPDNIDDAQAAAIPLVGLTAWQALHEHLKIQADQNILITAGAGGVGSLAIQFAKLSGLNVVTTASEKNREYLISLGADHVIDYTHENVVAKARKIVPRGFDAVLDGAGGLSLEQAWDCFRPGGRLVSIVEQPSEAKAAEANAIANFHFVYANGPQLETISSLIADGRLKIPKLEIRSIKDCIKAMDDNQARHVSGKIVLKIDF